VALGKLEPALYRLTCSSALAGYLGGGELQIDNTWVESRIHPVVLRRNDRLFAGAGRRAAAVMTLTQSARLNG
jgi:hypothetical protein